MHALLCRWRSWTTLLDIFDGPHLPIIYCIWLKLVARPTKLQMVQSMWKRQGGVATQLKHSLQLKLLVRSSGDSKPRRKNKRQHTCSIDYVQTCTMCSFSQVSSRPFCCTVVKHGHCLTVMSCLRGFQIRCLSHNCSMKCSALSPVTNQSLPDTCQKVCIDKEVQCRRLRSQGHVGRMQHDSLPKRLLFFRPLVAGLSDVERRCLQ